MEGQINEQKNDIILIGQDCGQNNVQMETRGTCNYDMMYLHNRKLNSETMTNRQIKEWFRMRRMIQSKGHTMIKS